MDEESTDDHGVHPVTTDDEQDTEDSEWGALDAAEAESAPDSHDEERDDQSAVGGNVFGSAVSDTDTIEPGTPTLENTVFVVVGLVLASLVFFQFYLLIG